jgi:hypothetical protein
VVKQLLASQIGVSNITNYNITLSYFLSFFSFSSSSSLSSSFVSSSSSSLLSSSLFSPSPPLYLHLLFLLLLFLPLSSSLLTSFYFSPLPSFQPLLFFSLFLLLNFHIFLPPPPQIALWSVPTRYFNLFNLVASGWGISQLQCRSLTQESTAHNTETNSPRLGFELDIPEFERAKTFRAGRRVNLQICNHRVHSESVSVTGGHLPSPISHVPATDQFTH